MALLDERKIDLANDTLVVRDRADHKILHFFDPNNGKPQGDGTLKHEYDIMELTVNQCGQLNDRNVAFRDHVGAVYIAMVKTFGISQRMVKIGSLVEQLVFNDVTNMLCGISEGKIAVWPLPNIAFQDRNLLQKSLIQKTIGSVGKFPQLANFAGNTIVIRKSDGCLVPTGILPFYGTLISMTSQSKWDQAIRLCRSIGNETLWATLAGLAVIHKNMIAMEISYAALEDDEKVALINEIKDKSDKETRQAMQVVLTGKLADADVLLERNGHSFRALMLNIQMFKWKRALEIGFKNKQWLVIVMGYREKYLKNCGQKESDPMFLKHMSEVEIDWVHIRELIAAERTKGNY
uniref:Clathrin heavy chain n=1 Tax=Caenorhabditis tropicalis TaxID=1561998 RepID=A0A1I7UPT7_9PELO